MSTFTSSGIQKTATFLLDDLRSNGCAGVAKTSVSDFQSDYNAAGGAPKLAVDGKYGPLTSAGLQLVIDANDGYAPLAGETAPTGCTFQGGGGGGALPPTVVSTAGAGSGPLPYIVGAIVVAGALAAYTYSKKKHRRR